MTETRTLNETTGKVEIITTRTVDSCVFVGCETDSIWIESAEKTYHVSFDDVEPMY